MENRVGETSIFDDIKQMLGLELDNESFDVDVRTHLNTALFQANQLGIGPKSGFRVHGREEEWVEFIQDYRMDLEGVKSYIYLCVKLIFDPPDMGYYVSLMEKQRDELAWRLVVQAESLEATS